MGQTPTILVVEDDSSIVRLLEIMLKAQGYRMKSTEFGAQVMALVAEFSPSLVILYIHLPDASGIDLVSQVREATDAPIMVLTATNSDVEKVSSFGLGADDYVVKPFSVAELQARVDAILRRSYRANTQVSKVSNPPPARPDPILINSVQRRAYIHNQEISLTPKEFQLLQLLLGGQGRLFTREHILDQVWGIHELDIETRAVDACVSRLRKKIMVTQGRDIIETVPGYGYRLSFCS